MISGLWAAAGLVPAYAAAGVEGELLKPHSGLLQRQPAAHCALWALGKIEACACCAAAGLLSDSPNSGRSSCKAMAGKLGSMGEQYQPCN